jgi:uncharacterized membrane protein
MEFCGGCGTRMNEGATFCGTCGKSSAPDVMSAKAVDSTAAETATPTVKTPPSGGISTNVAAALCYLFGVVSGIILLVIEPFKNDRFVRFHALQSIFFNLAWIGLWIVGETAIVVFEAITGGFLAVLIIPVSLVFTLGSMAYWFFLMYSAYSGQQHRIPLISRLAEQQANK